MTLPSEMPPNEHVRLHWTEAGEEADGVSTGAPRGGMRNR